MKCVVVASKTDRQQCTEEAQWRVWTAYDSQTSGLWTFNDMPLCDKHAAERAAETTLRKPITEGTYGT